MRAAKNFLRLRDGSQFGVTRDVRALHDLIGSFDNNFSAFANERRERQLSLLSGGSRQANATLHHYGVEMSAIAAVRFGNHCQRSQ
jgi:hypothetical protein